MPEAFTQPQPRSQPPKEVQLGPFPKGNDLSCWSQTDLEVVANTLGQLSQKSLRLQPRCSRSGYNQCNQPVSNLPNPLFLHYEDVLLLEFSDISNPHYSKRSDIFTSFHHLNDEISRLKY